MLTAHFTKYNKPDENVIERVLTSNSAADYESPEKKAGNFAHGKRSFNQSTDRQPTKTGRR
jgi:phosphate starvation-inducible PhoH-like protein